MTDRSQSGKSKLSIDIGICAPQEPPIQISNSGRWEEGDIVMNRDGLVIRGNVLSSPTNSGDSVQEQQIEQRMSQILLKDLQIIKNIGQGSTGIVQKAFHPTSGQFIALKVIPLEAQEQVRKQIVIELKTLIECRSPYIIDMISAFYVDASVYMVLEYMNGTLADIVRAMKHIPENVVSKIAPQVLYGLKYLHSELKMVHRDIKPSNLLVDFKGNVKISDFSVSGKLTNTLSHLASFVGTVTYMSPDRIQGLSYSFETDIWSFGLTLMECANGAFPYALTSAQAGFFDLMDQIVESEPPRLSTEQFSTQFADFVSKCMHKEPRKRMTVSQLLQHPFLSMKYEEVDLGQWFCSAIKIIRPDEPTN